MQIIEQSHKIISLPGNVLETIESVARTCYKSEGKMKPGSAQKMVKMLIDKGHEAMIEFGTIIVHFTTNRGVTHELVRHRLCSFAQESTRYVRYGDDMEFIKPVWWDEWSAYEQDRWVRSMRSSSKDYMDLIDSGSRPEQAREVLPNSLKTEINVQGNLREWRHIFKLRCSKVSHPQIRALMLPLLKEVSGVIPVVFDDLVEKYLKGDK